MSPHPERRGPRIVLAILTALALAGILLADAHLNAIEHDYEQSLRR